jgi:hypothetical protein
MCVAAAIIGGSAVTAGASIYGANKTSKASQRAADSTTAEAQRQFDITRADTADQRQLGNESIDKLRAMFLGGDTSAITADPGYKFGAEQGQRAIDNSLVARGLGMSGAALKAGARFATDYATTKTNDVTQRLLAMAGLGSQGINTSAQVGGNTAGIIANANTNNAANKGSSYLTAASGVNNSIQGGLQNYLLNKYLAGPNLAGGAYSPGPSTYAYNYQPTPGRA